MSENRNRTPRLSGILASLVMVPLMLVVPASLPLCDMAAEACVLDAPVVPAGGHCRMDVAGVGTMPCCVDEAPLEAPSPAVPGKADADLRVQLKAQGPAVTLAAAVLVAPAAAGADLAPAAAPAAPAVPLYTLLSTLLS